MIKGAKVLVAGGTGTIGIPLCQKLVQQGAHVTVVSLDSESFAAEVLGPEVNFQQGDLKDPAFCKEVMQQQEMVFNLVGIKGSTGIGFSKAADVFVSMLMFQTHLMEAAYRSGISRYLFVSSICAYPQSDSPRKEEELWNGVPKQNDLYAGIAKRVGELQGEAYWRQSNWDAVRVVRPSNVYGPYDDFDPATGQVIPSLIKRMLDGENPVQVWGDGSAVRDFIFSEDVAEGILLAVEQGSPCDPINLGAGGGVTIRELAETIADCVEKHTAVRPKIEWDPSKPAGDPTRVLSAEKAKTVLGFKPKTNLEDGIGLTVDWVVAHPKLVQRDKGVLHG